MANDTLIDKRLNNRSKSFGETPNQSNIFNFDRDDNVSVLYFY